MAARRSASPLRADDIAIVGMACLFPQSPNLRRYWENILRRRDCTTEVTADRWDADVYFDSNRTAADCVYSKWGGFLDAVRFDPTRWKIPPASLLSIDPIQLLSLEVAAQALDDAHWSERPGLNERTGCLFACSGSHDVGGDYAFRAMLKHYLPRVKDLAPEVRAHITEELFATLPEWTEDSFPGFLPNVIAGRIANRFDLGGPNYVVDAACAASLAALHAAMGPLRTGTVDAMIVGAADGTNNPFCFLSFAKTHALSPRGRSRPFDHTADGIALGEGIAAIVLRRLADAEQDGDRIYAVIKGIGASSDGRHRSLTAPHPPGQILAMRRAYDDAEVSPASVALVEAHGTGTAVGDSTEIASLTAIFSEPEHASPPLTMDGREATDVDAIRPATTVDGTRQPCVPVVAVGSVKSNIGHTKTCAGLASLVKTALALHQRVLPPTLHVEQPNAQLGCGTSPVYVNTETRPWCEELGDTPRRAGVSAFGFGGTNFHVVMEEYTGEGPSRRNLDLAPRAAELCVWKRQDRQNLLTTLRSLLEELETTPVSDLAQLARSILVDETPKAAFSESRVSRCDAAIECGASSVSNQPGFQACRLAIVAESVPDLQRKLQKAIENIAKETSWSDPAGVYYSEAPAAAPEQVAFLYPGQGSQATNMLRDVLVVSPWAQPLFTDANQCLRDVLPQPLTRLMYPPPVFSPEAAAAQQTRINDTAVAQPALGLVEIFATQLLAQFGLQPAAVAGHSYGEVVAVHVAGALTVEDMLIVSAERGRLAAEASVASPGGMAAVAATAAQTRQSLAARQLPAKLANLNAPNQTIIAGAVDVMERAVKELNADGLRAKRLPVTAAFHTAAMAPAAAALGRVLQTLMLSPLQRPVYSNTLAARYPTQPQEICMLLQRHLVEPVRFEEQMRRMRADGYEIFIEVGPGRALSGLLSRIFAKDSPTVFALDAPGRDGVLQLAHVLAQAAVLGLPVDLTAWFDDRGLKPVTTEAWLAECRATAAPKPSDWIVSVHAAKPVTPLPGKPGISASPPDAAGHNSNGHARSPDPAPMPMGHGHTPSASNLLAETSPREIEVTRFSVPSAVRSPMPTVSAPVSTLTAKVNGVSASSEASPTDGLESLTPTAARLLQQSQALMQQLLDLQQTQQHVALRFLEAHQQLVQQCTAWPSATPQITPQITPAATPLPTCASAAAPVFTHVAPIAKPAPVGVLTMPRPVAVPPAPRPATSVAPHPSHIKNGATPAAVVVRSAAAVPTPKASHPQGLPTVAEFQRELLQVVSERTGYPVDMLDVTLPMEAGLGIDSIKTVEIFSTLKRYHAFFQDSDDEEEAIKEFTSFKTLGDIVRSYETRYQTVMGHSQAAETPAVVERYTLETVSAPAGSQKKSTPGNR